MKSGINNFDEVPPPFKIDLLSSCYVELLKTKETYCKALEELLSGTSNNTTDPDFTILGEYPTGEGINVIKASLNLIPEQVYAGTFTNTKLRKMMSNYLHVGLSCTAQNLAQYKLELENVIRKQLCIQLK